MRRKSDDDSKKVKADVVKVPIDTNSEAVLIGAVVADETARYKHLVNGFPPDYFFGPGHAAMWSALKDLYRRGLEYSKSAIATIDGDADVEALDAYVRSYEERRSNLRLHVDRVRWNKSRKDAAEGPVANLLEKLRDPTSSSEDLKTAARLVSEAFQHGDLRYLRSSAEIADEHLAELRARREGKAVFRYGLPGLDRFGPEDFEILKSGERVSLEGKFRMIPGARPGDITVVTGESGHGKTTAMARMILEMGRDGRRILWGAWEQQNHPSLELLALLELGMSRADVLTGRYSSADVADVHRTMHEVGASVRFFDLPFGRDSSEERRYNRDNLNLIHQYVAESGCDVFVADLFSDSLVQTGPDDEASALARMKAIAIECKCHIFLVHWLRHKGLSERADKRPTRDLVLGSGAWIGKSDTVLAFYRPGLYDGNDKTIECHVLKQRHGPWPLAIEFDWDPEYGSIENGRSCPVSRPNEKTELDVIGDIAPARRASSSRRRK